MGYVLLAPEFVILLAARQHYAARKFTKKHQANTGWTRAHAFFLIMGGFTLHEGGKAVRVLEAKDLEELSEGENIEWPTITEEEIADRSKGDYLSKTIVLAQTTWFIIQCIARGAYGLAVTELEVATLAFATLTGVIYYFWWDKPLDVRCSVPVHLLPGQLRKNKEGIEKKDTGSHIIPSPEVSDHAIPEGDGRVVLNPNPTPIQGETSTPDPALTSTGSHIISPPEVFDQEILEGDENVVVNPNPLPLTSIQVDTFAPDPALTRMQRFQAKLFGLGYVFVVFPLERFLRAFQDMMMCKTLRDNPLRVPTFYSPPNEKDDNFIQFIWYCVSIIFGAIHCIAWSFYFTTLQERWTWRISAVLVSGLPISTAALSGLYALSVKVKNTARMKLYQRFINCIMGAICFFYIIARIALLVLPFMALRALPPGAYTQLDWISFLPHI